MNVNKGEGYIATPKTLKQWLQKKVLWQYWDLTRFLINTAVLLTLIGTTYMVLTTI